MQEAFCLITGASQGLGRALAIECASRGLDLLLVALPGTGLGRLARELAQRYSVRTEQLEIDLSRDGSAAEVEGWIRKRGFAVGILINNAGIGCHGSFLESPRERISELLGLNICTLVELTHRLLPMLWQRPGSHVLNVASLAAFRPMPTMPVYASSKSFVLNFSLALAEELRGGNVRVSVLCPGGIPTNQDCRIRITAQGLSGRLTSHSPAEVARFAVRGMLQGRRILVPGFWNKLLRLATQLIPGPLLMRVAGRRFGRVEQGLRPGPPALRSPTPASPTPGSTAPRDLACPGRSPVADPAPRRAQPLRELFARSRCSGANTSSRSSV